MTEMSHEDGHIDERRNIDARDQRDGGWSWIQNDIYTLFLPIIGREATHLYQVMTYLIPERIRNPLFDLTVRKIGEVALMSKSSVQRNLKVLHAVGLMPRVSDDPPMFLLADLRKLVKVGRAELARRVAPFKRASVPLGDNDEEGLRTDPEQEQDARGPQDGAGSDDLVDDSPTPQKTGEAVPEASDDGLVPQGDKGADEPENLWKKADAEPTLSPKPAFLVPQEGVLVPEKGGFCPPGGTAYIEVSKQSESKNPTPYPRPGGGAEQNPISYENAPEGRQAQTLWTAFIAELQDQMHDVPIGLHSAKRWKQISAEHHDDFEACFSAWWPLEVQQTPAGVTFVTYADDEAVTEAGIAKYRKRLTLLLRQFFSLAPEEQVNFTVLRAPQEPAPDTDGESHSNGHATNGESRTNRVLPEARLWEQAKQELRETRAKAAELNPRIELEWAEQAVEAARLEAVEAGDRKPIWKMRSPAPEKTRAAITMFRPSIEKAIGDVQFVILPLDEDASP